MKKDIRRGLVRAGVPLAVLFCLAYAIVYLVKFYNHIH